MATIATYGDCEHTLVERGNYNGVFLPGFVSVESDPIQSLLPKTGILLVDHVVGNQGNGEMEIAYCLLI